ncbi:NlpC/P60 family protein [Amycolatopsis xylanica]|uniref:NlpC/P60 family protein n=1 Tax=Amycolatopsis xylanica TaxID=589385 RepID=A0A1H2TYU1_9PSEU|nr:NlpC/P60 family protein [Amycolatopsis xylanica]SDW48900.1 NlpC/P60 family protein [Amycolatopsis xylanica]
MRGKAFVLATVLTVSGTAAVYYAAQGRDGMRLAPAAAVAAPRGGEKFTRLTDPPRTVVTTANGAVVATLTDGSRTVVLTGPARTFSELRSAQATVTTTAWVRLAPEPWSPGTERAPWFKPWLTAASADTTPDVLAVGSQYLDGAPAVRDQAGRRIAGDAAFGRDADYDDYLGTGALDSAGFVRLVYGYREGYPLRDNGLPRTAAAMAGPGPGTPVVPDSGRHATDYSHLQPGDLLFFTKAPAAGEVTRVGIYLGLDDDGHRRVLASSADTGGPSFLDTGADYARTFRSAKRL